MHDPCGGINNERFHAIGGGESFTLNCFGRRSRSGNGREVCRNSVRGSVSRLVEGN